MTLHKEASFEDEIFQHLADDRWLYADNDATNYGRSLALFPDDVSMSPEQARERVVTEHGEFLLNTLSKIWVTPCMNGSCK
ncbi:hypothetical protein [Rhodopirellula baltica]|uniref:hypothetical protein n=1 Tax=Rhodopirellula baltica TaxID=265606 RepID=UPI001181798D|nr:hypothetical protein [Rhodopirellula baltica]